MTGMVPRFDSQIVTQAERNALAAVLVHAPTAWPKVSGLRPEQFGDPKCRATIHAMHELAKAGHPIDGMTVATQLRAFGAFDKLDGQPNSPTHYERHVDELYGDFVTFDNLDFCVREINKAASRREIDAAAVQHLAKMRMGGAPAEFFDSLRQLEQLFPAIGDEGFPTISAGDVADPGPTRWLVDDLWISGGCGLLAGEPKTKKSLFTLSLAVAVASGGKVLSRFQARQTPVLIFNAEDRLDETASRLRRMCNALGIRLADLPIHMINVTGMRLDKPEDMRKLSATVRRIKPGLVVLDPLRNLFDGNEDNSQDVNAALSPLRALQREHDCAVIVVHHMTKPNELKRRPGQRMRGSGALHGWGDCNLYVELKGDVSAVEVEQRYAPACDSFGWRARDMETPEGKALWCEPTTIPANVASDPNPDAQDAAKASLEQQIVLLLSRAAKPMTTKQIRETLQAKTERCQLAIQALFQNDEIDHVELTIERANGRPYTSQAWTLKGRA